MKASVPAGRRIVLGFENSLRLSGFAAYGAWFDGTVISDNPTTKHVLAEGEAHQV